MFAGKPIIGIAGGIGSGKSFIARIFGEMNCAVVDSDAQVRAVYENPEVLKTLRQWWGDLVFQPNGTMDRAAVARRIFRDSAERARLEALVHPLVNAARIVQMEKWKDDQQVLAFVWDTPLLFEAGLRGDCDAVVFVDAPQTSRLERVMQTRRWDEAELIRRENLQWPLDKKRDLSDYVIQNAADAGEARRQVRDVLSRVLDSVSQQSDPK